jgi:hypothetical protein
MALTWKQLAAETEADDALLRVISEIQFGDPSEALPLALGLLPRAAWFLQTEKANELRQSVWADRLASFCLPLRPGCLGMPELNMPWCESQSWNRMW